MLIRFAAVLAGLVLAGPSSLAQDDAAAPWRAAALALAENEMTLSGPGADWLATRLEGAQSVLVGEQHGVDGLARLTAALEAEFQPDVLVLEAGPWIGERLTETPVRDALAAAPYSLAFDYNGDIALIERFQVRLGAGAPVWGVDQEANAIHPYAFLAQSADAGAVRRTARGLHLKAALDAGEYIPRDHQHDLVHLAAQAGGDERVAAVVDHVSTSMSIFTTWRSGARGEASALREQYMIENYDARRAVFEASADRPPRILFKMGGAHIMEGATGPNGVMTLGEHVQRRADDDGAYALHLGVRGFNPDTTPYPIDDLIAGQSLLLLDTAPLRAAVEAGLISGLAEDARADLYGYDALIYINPLERASKSEISALQADFRSDLLTRLGLHFWPAPILIVMMIGGAGLLAARLVRKAELIGPVLTLTGVSAAVLGVFGLQIFALVSTAPGAAAPGPAVLPWLAPLLALGALADTAWRGRSGAQARFVAGLIWAGLLVWLAIAMHRWNFGGMLG